MSTFPALKGAEVIRALQRLGFDLVRIKGSHHFLRHPDGRCPVITNAGPANLTLTHNRHEYTVTGVGTERDRPFRRWNANQGTR